MLVYGEKSYLYKMENVRASLTQLNYKSIFQALPGSFLVLTPDSLVLEASKQYLKITNKTSQELIGVALLDAFPLWPSSESSKSSEAISHSLRFVVENKTSHTLPCIRYDIKGSSGSFEERYWTLCSSPVLDALGNVEVIVHEVRDITDQAKKEQEAAAAEGNLQVMAKATGGIFWESNILENKITWSESYKKILGYSDADLEVALNTWDGLVHPDDLAATKASINAAVESRKKLWTAKYRYRKADGSYTKFIDHGYIIYDDQLHTPVRMLGSMVDINKQQAYEYKLQEVNQRFQRIAMATNDVIWDWNLEDDSIWWNEGFKTLFGYEAEDIEDTAVSWTSRIHPEDLERVKTSIHHIIDSGQYNWHDEYRFRSADGSYKLVFDRGYVIHDQQGKATRMIGAMLDITEKRYIEQQLQESMAQTTQILESLPLMTWTALPSGEINYYSQRWYDYTGSNYEEMQAWGWSKLIHPDDLAFTTQLWLKSLSTGEPLVLENRFKSDNGQYRWFLVRALPIRDSQGNITQWVGSHTDIEEHKQMMLALEESNHKFKLLAESIPHIVWSSDTNGHVDYFNQQWYDYTKMSGEETLGFGWALTLHPDDVAPTNKDWLDSMHTGQSYGRELRLCNIHTKEYRWFLARALPMRNTEGEITKWFGTATDIHDIKVLREQLQESEKQFRFLAESIPQMVWTTRPDGFHEYFNQRWIDYTGLTVEASINTKWHELLHPDDRARAKSRWQHSLDTGDYYEVEYRFRNGFNGNYHWFLGQAMPMRDENGNIVKWFGTCTDIEDHKKAEEELVEKNLELERINQDLDSFVYTASHDLKLPILNMSGIFEELTRNAEFKDPDAPKLIELFNKSFRQLHNTIHDLGEVVRVQKTKARNLEDISLQEIANDVLVSVQDVIKSSGASITCHFTEVPTVSFTRASLKSILYNLISNALKYRSHDRTPEIMLRTAIKGNYIELTIRDNGLGFDLNKQQSKLFQMFKRFHNHVEGSGLGLYIVNRLLTNHSGYINVESELNKGTTFYLYFKNKKA